MEYIIGGGITGLLTAYLRKEAILIEENKLGGQLNRDWPLGPQYLHCTDEIENLLRVLGLPATKRILKIGYWDNGFITPTKEHFKSYSMKTRGSEDGWNEHMMRGIKGINVFTMSPKMLVLALIDKVRPRVMIDSVEEVWFDKKELKLKYRGIVKYDTLINTIPAPTFVRLVKDRSLSSLDFNYSSSWFVYASTKRETPLHIFLWEDAKDYEFIYFPTSRWIPSRIVKLTEPMFVGESTSPKLRRFFEKFDSDVLDEVNLPMGKIGGGDKRCMEDVWMYDTSTVIQVGRWAQWNGSVMIHDIPQILRDKLGT